MSLCTLANKYHNRIQEVDLVLAILYILIRFIKCINLIKIYVGDYTITYLRNSLDLLNISLFYKKLYVLLCTFFLCGHNNTENIPKVSLT